MLLGGWPDQREVTRSLDWATSEVNWWNTWDSGITFSVRVGWKTIVRQLPITSRSSHGQTTRGSSMTVEVFYPGDQDPAGDALRDFAHSLLIELEPILPHDRAEYYVP